MSGNDMIHPFFYLHPGPWDLTVSVETLTRTYREHQLAGETFQETLVKKEKR